MKDFVMEQVVEMLRVADEIAKKKKELSDIAKCLQACLAIGQKSGDDLVDFLMSAGPEGKIYNTLTHEYITKIRESVKKHQGELVIIVDDTYIVRKTVHKFNSIERDGHRTKVCYLGRLVGDDIELDRKEGNIVLPTGEKYVRIGKSRLKLKDPSKKRGILDGKISISIFSSKSPVKRLPQVFVGDEEVRKYFGEKKMESLLEEKLEDIPVAL